MSVIFFGAQELGNLAAWLAQDRFEQDGDLERYCLELSAYSVGNAAAYAYRYQGERAVAVSATEVMAVALELKGRPDAGAARRTVRLLSYNGPEGEGLKTFRGSQAYRAAMIDLLGRAFGKVDELL